MHFVHPANTSECRQKWVPIPISPLSHLCVAIQAQKDFLGEILRILENAYQIGQKSGRCPSKNGFDRYMASKIPHVWKPLATKFSPFVVVACMKAQGISRYHRQGWMGEPKLNWICSLQRRWERVASNSCPPWQTRAETKSQGNGTLSHICHSCHSHTVTAL